MEEQIRPDEPATGTDETGIKITVEAKIHLIRTAKWTKFLAVLYGIFMGLAILGGIIGGAQQTGGHKNLTFTLMILVILGIYIYPWICFYRFSVYTKKAVTDDDTEAMTQALNYQGKLYAFMGVFSIIMIVIYFLVFLTTMPGNLG